MKFFFLVIMVLSYSPLISQEICNNAIDDDGDGLVDLNDTEDCSCPTTFPSGIIPNPSFENRTCCPNSGMDLDCAVDWIQASEATSDYFHTCGITEPHWVDKSPPLPLPDGDGYVGFRDGRPTNGQFKEYIGACLNETMEVGIEYRLDFFLGFAPELEQTIDMTIYGTTECSNIPFAPGNESIGCPTNVPGWTQLGQLTLSGQGEWVNVIFDFLADKPYNVIVLGPGCNVQDDLFNEWYFFVDRLALAQLTDFEVPFASIEGSLCDDNLTIIAEDNEDYGYQWYKDGAALIGETSTMLELEVSTENEGLYEVLISTPTGCFNSVSYELYVPILQVDINPQICEGESFSIAGTDIMEAGQYTFTLLSSIGCDSIVNVDLELLSVSTSFIEETLCEGEIIQVAGQNLDTAGNYSFSLPAANGCDSLIAVSLIVNEVYDSTIDATICEGDIYIIGNDALNQAGTYNFNLSTISGCDSMITIDLSVAEIYNTTSLASVCAGDTFFLAETALTTAGTYEENLQSIDGCDSMVQLVLTIDNITTSEIISTICEGESYEVADTSISISGQHELTTINSEGCDSIISLDLTVISWNDGVILPSDTLVTLGDPLTISPLYIDPSFKQVVWTDQEGQVLSNDNILSIPTITNNQNITLTAVDEYSCIDEDEIQIRVDRNIGIYVPNIFSPNGDGVNDYFRPVVNGSIATLREFYIYDRWGNQVHTADNQLAIENWLGWDGKINGKDAITGVYVYIGTFIALDNLPEMISGNITLIR